jgi:hypothetical protein
VIGSRRYRALELNQPSQDSGDASDQVEVALVKIEVAGFDFRLAAYRVVGLWDSKRPLSVGLIIKWFKRTARG